MRAVTHQVAAFMLEYKTFYITSKLLLLKNKGGGPSSFVVLFSFRLPFQKIEGGGERK